MSFKERNLGGTWRNRQDRGHDVYGDGGKERRHCSESVTTFPETLRRGRTDGAHAYASREGNMLNVQIELCMHSAHQIYFHISET